MLDAMKIGKRHSQFDDSSRKNENIRRVVRIFLLNRLLLVDPIILFEQIHQY